MLMILLRDVVMCEPGGSGAQEEFEMGCKQTLDNRRSGRRHSQPAAGRLYWGLL
jgi:hypothetical protein